MTEPMTIDVNGTILNVTFGEDVRGRTKAYLGDTPLVIELTLQNGKGWWGRIANVHPDLAMSLFDEGRRRNDDWCYLMADISKVLDKLLKSKPSPSLEERVELLEKKVERLLTRY